MINKNNKYINVISNNKKAYYNYFIIEEIECGIVLKGSEVKSLRLSSCNINDAFCSFKNMELLIYNMHISSYVKSNNFNVDNFRVRKLLLHKIELKKIFLKTKIKQYNIIPLKIYFKNSKIKLKIALSKGKKLFDKRHTEKAKEIDRKIQVIQNY